MTSEFRLRTLELGAQSLQTPALFAAYRLGDYPSSGLKTFPWKITGTRAVLVSAYDILTGPYGRNVLEGKETIFDHLQFAGPVMMDSGAYSFIKKGIITIDARDVLNVQIRSKAQLGVVLDHPFLPNSNTILDHLRDTYVNTYVMFRELSKEHDNNSFQLIPVIHGHDYLGILDSIGSIHAILRNHQVDNVKIVGIGSLVPLSKVGSYTDRQRILDIIAMVRRQLPKAHIHCFSLGSSLMMLLAFYCGADSVDSHSWMINAAYKYVQLPGFRAIGLRMKDNQDRLSKNLSVFKQRAKELEDSEGFKLPYDDIEGKLLDTDKNNVHYRACHNLYVYNYEVNHAHEAIKVGRFEEFVQSRVSGTAFESLFDHVKALMKKNKRLFFFDLSKEKDKYLLVLSCSRKKNVSEEPLPTLDCYDGPYYRVIRKLDRNGSIPDNLDIIIISAKYGLIGSKTFIHNYDEFMTKEKALMLLPNVSQRLNELVKRNHYREIFVNLGKNYRVCINGVLNKAKQRNVVTAKGSIGKRTRDMRHWLCTINGINGAC